MNTGLGTRQPRPGGIFSMATTPSAVGLAYGNTCQARAPLTKPCGERRGLRNGYLKKKEITLVILQVNSRTINNGDLMGVVFNGALL